MFEQKCRIKELARSLDGNYILSLKVPRSILNVYDEYNGRDLRIKLNIWREKRSLDANAYFWLLCGRLAEKLRISPESIYRELIKDIGGNYTVVPIKNEAVEKWIKNWESRGIGWLCDTTDSKLEGYTNVITYYGSSAYDSAQMSRLISLIVEECKINGIETATPEELSLLTEGWN